jgi:hypothetical protein
MKYWGYAIAVAAILFVAWVLNIWLRYVTGRKKSQTWPAAPATIEVGTIANISRGVAVSVPAVFFNYRFTANDRSYTGLFVVSGGSNRQLGTVKDRFTRKTINVHYDPANPKISYIEPLPADDLIGFKASQNPFWLRQAPVPSISETIKFS